MTDFQEWWELRKARSQGMYDATSLSLDAYLAGQASAEQSIENFSLACESYRTRITEQLETIKALNDCIGGKGSLTTDNLVLVGRLEHQIAELERERDVWKRKAELPMKYKRMTYNAELQKEIEALKAQAGEREPVAWMCWRRWASALICPWSVWHAASRPSG